MPHPYPIATIKRIALDVCRETYGVEKFGYGCLSVGRIDNK